MPLRPLTEYNTGGIETAMTRFQYGHAGHERGQYLWQVIMMHAWGQVSAVAASSSSVLDTDRNSRKYLRVVVSDK